MGLLGSWIWDIQRNLVFCSELIAEYCGVSAEAAQHGLPLDLYQRAVIADDQLDFYDQVRQALATADRFRISFHVEAPRFGRRRLLIVGNAHFDSHGRPVVMHGCTFDVGQNSVDLAAEHIAIGRAMLPGGEAGVAGYLVDALLIEIGRMKDRA